MATSGSSVEGDAFGLDDTRELLAVLLELELEPPQAETAPSATKKSNARHRWNADFMAGTRGLVRSARDSEIQVARMLGAGEHARARIA
jgi:hypothetical protein